MGEGPSWIDNSLEDQYDAHQYATTVNLIEVEEMPFSSNGGYDSGHSVNISVLWTETR